ncbi:putative ribonuclease H-like domain-containing protein [Tanacetum coccineum]
MKDKFQMSSMGELTFFLGLQVQQKKKGIFISQDKYVHEILKKFNYTDVKSIVGSCDVFSASRPDNHVQFVHVQGDMLGATLDRKSTPGGCQFLGNRLFLAMQENKLCCTSTTDVNMWLLQVACGPSSLDPKPQFHDLGNARFMLSDGHSLSSLKNHIFTFPLLHTSFTTPEPSPTQPSPPHPSPTQFSPTQPGTEYHPPTPHDSPLHAVHSHGSEEGSLKLQELMNLINTLLTEAQIKVGKARRHSRFVLSDTEVAEDDSSKQGRKFSNEGVQDDEGVHEKASTETERFYTEHKMLLVNEVPPVSTAELNIKYGNSWVPIPITAPEGFDLMLWGDLHTLFEPDENDEIWKDQHEYNLLSWRLHDFCGIHILLMNNGLAIHMLTEKKYPLSQEMLSKMLSTRLEVDHESSQAFELLRFIRAQGRIVGNKSSYDLILPTVLKGLVLLAQVKADDMKIRRDLLMATILPFKYKDLQCDAAECFKSHALNGSIKYNQLSSDPPKVKLSRATSAGGLTYL